MKQKRMKKVTAFLLSMAMLLQMLSGTAWAQEIYVVEEAVPEGAAVEIVPVQEETAVSEEAVAEMEASPEENAAGIEALPAEDPTETLPEAAVAGKAEEPDDVTGDVSEEEQGSSFVPNAGAKAEGWDLNPDGVWTITQEHL
ncbi:MAG: hypothetical protein K5697_00490, partial [Lachnospiraceae bacterium]|nr:hypothetical protein [Lachnospiraceae bacterium]